MTEEEKREFEELKKRVSTLEEQIHYLNSKIKQLSGFNSLNQKYR